MNRSEWNSYLSGYEKSGLTMKQYCAKHGISFHSFRNRRYKGNRAVMADAKQVQPMFKEFKVGLNLHITVGANDSISLHGLSADHLPDILRVLHAVS